MTSIEVGTDSIERTTSRFESPWSFVALSVLVVALGCLLWFLIDRAYPKLSDQADFGNLFGGINTLFAALAFAALTFTLILQQRALQLQRKDLHDQQQELLGQNARIERQAFEALLLQLLGFHHQLVKDIHVRVSAVDYFGR